MVVGDIAIIASSSRSRSDFERDLEVEIQIDFEIDFRPGPELDNKTSLLSLAKFPLPPTFPNPIVKLGSCSSLLKFLNSTLKVSIQKQKEQS